MTELPTDTAIKIAAETLPEGWTVEIVVEEGAATVYLYNHHNEPVDWGDSADLSLGEQVYEATQMAININDTSDVYWQEG